MPEKTSQRSDMTPVEYAISLVGGNASALARMLGVTPQSVFCWKKHGVIPAKRAKDLSKILGVPRKKFNPEVFD